MRELYHRPDQPAMRFEPMNVPIARAAHWFNLGKPVFVTLEPGDDTRYDLMLVRNNAPHARIATWGNQDVVTVVRYRGGHAIEADNFRWPYEGEHVLENLGKTNAWTRTLLDWWLEVFAEATRTKADYDSANNAQSSTT